MIVDYADKALTQRYQLMAQTIIPRPIAWIVTQNEQGLVNIAPFSYFMGLSSEPATMIVSIEYKSDSSDKEKITLDYTPVSRVGKSYALLGEEIVPPKIP